MSTAESQPAEKSLIEDLETAIDETENKDEEKVEETTEEVDEETTEDDEETEASDESEEQDSDDDDSTDGEEDEELDEELEALEAPIHWAAEDRETFDSAPRETQEFILRRHKEMEADYTRKTQETAEARKRGEQFNEVLAPYREQFSLQGMDDVGAVRQLATIYGQLQQNPAETVAWLAQQYGVDLSQPEQGEVDPAIQVLQDKISGVETLITQQNQTANQQAQQQIQTQISDFAQLKDEAGNIKHSHFEAVKEQMGQLVGSGIASDLDDAYAKAVQLHPELVEQDTAKERDRKDAEAKERKKKAAAKAKKAASGVKSGTTTGKKASAEMTLDDEIRSLVNQSQ